MKPGRPHHPAGRGLPVAGSEQVIEVDGLIRPSEKTIDPALAGNGKTGAPARGPVIVGGDAAGGRRTVADAAASGKRAAITIDNSLSGRTADRAIGAAGSFRAYYEKRSVVPSDPVRFDELNADYFEQVPSVVAKKTVPEVRVRDFSEVTRTYGEKAAVSEAGRCFVCGSCAGCEVCATFCRTFRSSCRTIRRRSTTRTARGAVSAYGSAPAG